MKSGKFCLGLRQTLKTLRQGKSKLVIIANNTPPLRWDWEVGSEAVYGVFWPHGVDLIIVCLKLKLFILIAGNLKLNTMPCWLRLVFITTLVTTLSLAQPVESTSECARCPSLIQEILTLLGLCLQVKEVKDSKLFFLLSCMVWNTCLYHLVGNWLWNSWRVQSTRQLGDTWFCYELAYQFYFNVLNALSRLFVIDRRISGWHYR